MQTQARPPRQRSSGGRTLMLLGLVLALAAAGLVLYVTNSVQGTFTATEPVVVAAENLKSGAILTLNNAQAPDVRIQDAFSVIQMAKNLVPADAFPFTNQDALNTDLNNQVVKEDFLKGDILRTSDPRLAAVGTTSGNSLTNINPPVLPDGSKLYTLPQKNSDLGLQPGDMIDILVTAPPSAVPGLPPTKDTSVTLFVMTKILVYAVDTPAKGDIIVVLTAQQVIDLVELEHDGNYQLTIVLRKPGDPTDPTTIPPIGGA